MPPHFVTQLLIAALPAIFASAFAAATATLGALSHARKTALRDSLGGSAGAALDRYLRNDSAIEARWLTLRVVGVAISAWYMGHALPEGMGAWRAPLGALLAVIAYGVPTEIVRVMTTRTADTSAPLLLQVLRPFELLAAPVAVPMVYIGRLVGRVTLRPAQPDQGVTETEVELLVNEGEQNGSLDREQSQMIRNVLEFGELSAGEVMVPRTRVTAYEIDTPAREVLMSAVQSGHSRYPVYREQTDNVVGILHVKDLLRHLSTGEIDKVSLGEVMRKPVAFVPETQLASGVLKDMRAGRHHMAVVIDEFGGMAGVVTLEDLIERIVGEIRDEYDVDEPAVVDLGEGRLMVDASIPIADLSRHLRTELPEDGDYNSLGGFITNQLGRVPRIGAKLSALGFDFVVREADERHVAKVEIVLRQPESVPPAGSSRISAA